MGASSGARGRRKRRRPILRGTISKVGPEGVFAGCAFIRVGDEAAVLEERLRLSRARGRFHASTDLRLALDRIERACIQRFATA